MSIDDLTDKALSIPSTKKDPEQAKSTLENKVKEAAEKEANKQSVEKAKTEPGEPIVSNASVQKRVKETLKKKEEESKDLEKVPDAKTQQKAQDDKEEVKAAEPVKKVFPKTPRKVSQGASCPNCYDDDVVLESNKRIRERTIAGVTETNEKVDKLDNDTRQKNGYACSDTADGKKCS